MIEPQEVCQAGDVFLLRFKCPHCLKVQFQGYPLEECSDCHKELKTLPIASTGRRRLLSGTRRKPSRISKKLVIAMYESQNNQCAYCYKDISVAPGYHVEHIIPLSCGGTNNPYNLCLSCPRCNLLAGSFYFSTFEAKQTYILSRR